MKRSSFAAMVLGMVSGVFFALGMCMALIPEWEAFRPGLVFGGVGLLLALVTWLVWREMEHKAPIRFSGKAIMTAAVGLIGALGLGVGMCFTMVWGKVIAGIVIGLVGIAMLLCLVPLAKGIEE